MNFNHLPICTPRTNKVAGQIEVEHGIRPDRLVLILVDFIAVERVAVPDDVGAMEDAQDRVVHRDSRHLREVRQIRQILKRPAVVGRYLRKRKAN